MVIKRIIKNRIFVDLNFLVILTIAKRPIKGKQENIRSLVT